MTLSQPSDRQSALVQSAVRMDPLSIPVIIAFFLNPSVLLSFFPAWITTSVWGLIATVLFVTVNILFYCGCYGSLTELMSGEGDYATLESFHRNKKRYWRPYLLVQAGLIVTHMIFSAVLAQLPVPFSLFQALGDIFVVTVLAQAIVADKYLQPLGLKPKTVILTRAESLILILFVGLSTGLFLLPYYWTSQVLDLKFVLLLLSRYTHFLIFLFITGLILRAYPEIKGLWEARKELILINPLGPGVMEGLGSLFIRSYPAFFSVLRALTPAEYHVREYNRIYWRDHFYRGRGLVAISCWTSNSYEAYRIAREFKKRGATVVMGGPHVTYFPQEALEFCDSVVRGEAEGVWPRVVEDYERGRLNSLYEGEAMEEYHQRIQEELLKSPPSVIIANLETTRGCKFKCEFCTIPSFSCGKVRKKPVAEIVALLKRIRGKINNVIFIDNNIYSDPEYAKELFLALKPLGLKWNTQCTLDIAQNEETLKLAKESGCTGFLVGYEIDDSCQGKVRTGKLRMADRYLEFSRRITRAGIAIKAHFIFGYDEDTWGALLRRWKFCFTLMPKYTVISLLTPFPGSHIYDRMVRENRFSNLNWRSFTGHAMVVRHPVFNSFWMTMAYPAIYVVFLMTTSWVGLWGLILVMVINHYFGII